MELKHLRTFLALSEIRNFTRTAETLHFAQSNVTTHIQQLEQELKVRLFERIGKRVTLTPAGSELIPYARRMLALSDAVADRFINCGAGGSLTIGASESICINQLPRILQAYQQAFPAVQVYLQVLDTDNYAALLGDNVIDAAFVLDEENRDPVLVTAFSAAEPIAVLACPHHPLAAAPTIAPEDLADVPMVLTGKGCCYRKQLEQELKQSGITPRLLLETGSIEVLKQMIVSGVGIGLLPESAVSRELKQGALVKLSYRAQYGIVSQLLYHKDKWLSENLKNFIHTAKRIN